MADAEEARILFAQACDFKIAASQPDHFPSGPNALPEVAFIGRSNVGKSSLINGLTGRKNLARASNTPGRTQQIIFFSLADRLMLVDLPGYGHAKAPEENKKQWNNLVKSYIRRQPSLRLVCVLIDSRHGIKPPDVEMMEFLDSAAISYQIVLTKGDQIKASEATTRLEETREKLKKSPAARPEPLMTSAERKQGLSELQSLLADFAQNPQR